jgi:hypothetical protein
MRERVTSSAKEGEQSLERTQRRKKERERKKKTAGWPFSSIRIPVKRIHSD